MAELVHVSIASGVANVRLNRPDRLNALDFALAQALLDALTRVDADPSVKAVALTGEGRALLAAVAEPVRELEVRMLAKLTEDQAAEFRQSLITAYGEFRSISGFIERTPGLDHLDSIGRIHR